MLPDTRKDQLSYLFSAPARITSFSSDIFYPQSQSLSLPCHTVGSPPPRLSWIHNNKLIHSGVEYQVLSDGTLVVKEIRENMNNLVCQVENTNGKDTISYSVSVVRSPVAPTIRVSKITTSSITLMWNSPHNGGALIQGRTTSKVELNCLNKKDGIYCNDQKVYTLFTKLPNCYQNRLFP